jgi:hypothetical protein
MKQDNQVVLFQSHPPERKRRSTVLLAHGCCCCCLHGAGGIAGSIWGSLRRNAPWPDSLTTPEAVRQEEELKAAHRLAVKVYWLVLTIMSFLSIVVTSLLYREDAIFGAVLTVIFLPALQLLASLLSLLWIPMKPPVRKRECLRRLGKITLYGVLGALIGSIGLVVTFFTIGR